MNGGNGKNGNAVKQPERNLQGNTNGEGGKTGDGRLESKTKALFIHGIGSGANSRSGQHVIRVLSEMGIECVSDSFDVLNPVRAVNRIMKHADGVGLIVGHSMGAFYLLGGALPEMAKKRILINPCALPIEKIPTLRHISDSDRQKYYAHAGEIYELQVKNEAAGESEQNRKNLFAVFAEEDDVLNFRDFFGEHFGVRDAEGSLLNVTSMTGGHRIQNDESVRGPLAAAIAYFGI